jgi:hypothetical protein
MRFGRTGIYLGKFLSSPASDSMLTAATDLSALRLIF